MKKLNRTDEFRRIDSNTDNNVGDNFYKEFIERFNDLVDSTGRQKIEIDIKKKANCGQCGMADDESGLSEEERKKIIDSGMFNACDTVFEIAKNEPERLPGGSSDAAYNLDMGVALTESTIEPYNITLTEEEKAEIRDYVDVEAMMKWFKRVGIDEAIAKEYGE